jgi:DNA-binding beta-propeller fold protein YncE
MTKKFHFAICVALLAVVATAILSASAKHASAPPASNPVWPPAPDEPRVVYVRSLRAPRDIGQSPSVFKRLGHWITGETGESLSLQKPFGLALDESGNLCITDTGVNRVYYCDFKRKQWRSYDGIGKTHFASPVAVARKNGIFYVADSQLGKVFAFRDDGKPIWEISTPLVRPVGVAINDDALAVVDSQAHTVFVFDLQGKLRFQFGHRGVEPGEFNFPTHIATDRQGHLLVTDSMNSRVQVFDPTGKFISAFGGNGDTSGHFGRPKGVAADTFGHVYVADAMFDNVQVFDLKGELLLNIGQTGNGPGEFGLPGGVAIGPDNQIYVADGYNHRVQVLKYVGRQ